MLWNVTVGMGDKCSFSWWIIFNHYTTYHIFTRGQLWPSGIVIACVYLCVCVRVCVYGCVCVRQSSVCPDDNLSPASATIINIGPEEQNTLVKIPIVLGFIDLNLQGQIELKSQNLIHFGIVSFSGP